ncbi:acyltransferase family protein [Massilia suwonensis]|uniref:Acyltransferase family protein n=1 Tax=Massilia suwonensis TaxID=648895 RepID=A0ABW0MPA6_9BURK
MFDTQVTPIATAGTKSAHPSRIFGLDALRALAVLLVLVGHTLAHQKPPAWIQWFWGAQGSLGVEIFFVLSGFLIGRILLKQLVANKLNNLRDLTQFLSRRWARTLPLYFAFLLIYFRFDYTGMGNMVTHAPFFVFLQNFAWQPIRFFEHSWSLAVEEWFYLLFPLLLLIAHKLTRSVDRAFWIAGTLFLVLPLLGRMWQVHRVSDWNDFNNLVRMVVACRLDSIFIGVLMAYLSVCHARWFKFVGQLAPIGIGALLVIAFYFACGAPGLPNQAVSQALLFPVISLMIATLLPGAIEWHGIDNGYLDRFIVFTSKISYSLYLGHIAMLTLVNSALEMYGVAVAGRLQTLAIYLVYFAFYYSFAFITYHAIEQPYLKLRDVGKKNSNVP